MVNKFTSDDISLIAPISSVLVTRNDGAQYNLVTDGRISLVGYPSIPLSSGANYGEG